MDTPRERDRVSWRAKLSGRLVFGVVLAITEDGYDVKHDRTGFIFHLTPGEVTKECP
jgi:hypothetical protein